MSILKKPYEISVWDDVWEDGQFVEKKLGIIGSDKMIAQCRVIEPNLVRNTNGSKKLTFKMYYKYIDNITGEETTNPFSKWLISERKIKLEYDNKWYDFIIKNIVENSSTYLYTYQLEDAIVTELSKNGFGTILDAKLQNNMNNAEELARTVLSETDWAVESEKIIEKVEENLVYATIKKSDLPKKQGVTSVKLYRLEDANEDSLKSQGVIETEVSWEDFFKNEEGEAVGEQTILVFYSSCKNKPYRFQFIYLNSYDKEDVKIHKNNRTIQEYDCQYFIEFWPNQYKSATEDPNGFIMPKGITSLVKTYKSPTIQLPQGSDGTISVWYKGNRYGYAQKAIYSNILNRYINEYKKVGRPNTEKYYGFIDNEYVSPILQTNLVTNTQFRSTNGWTGTYKSTSTSKSQATVSNVYGRFSGKFISSLEDLSNGITNRADEYKPYMKLSFVDNKSLVLNDGPYDNKAIIGNMEIGSQWALRVKYLNKSGGPGSGLSFAIKEYEYNSTGGYEEIASSSLSCARNGTKSVTIGTGSDAITKQYDIYIVTSQFASNKTFKELSNVKIAITGESGAEYYIEEIEFFQAKFNGETLITLDTQIDNTKVVIPTYYYFSEEKLNQATSIEDLEFDKKTDTVDTGYLPVFNEGAEKIRSVTVKESNYFNILQSIAETFECWVEFDIARDASGTSEKKVRFKNYIGKNNYACFRYGVNLKDIQRTYESKNITTKLIVKQNNNELGEDGFCTIQRAGANPTGESYIYDFQYYQNIGLMSADQYIDVLYEMSHNFGTEEEPNLIVAIGPDCDFEYIYSDSEAKPEPPTSFEDPAWGQERNEQNKWFCRWKKVGDNYTLIGGVENIQNIDECNIQGYFPRLRELNRKIIAENKLLSGTTLELREIKGQLSVSEALYSAAKEGAEEVTEDFKKLTGFEPDEIGQTITACTISGEWATDKEAARTGHKLYSSYCDKFTAKCSYSNKKLTITLTVQEGKSFKNDTNIFVYAYPELTLSGTKITIERVGKNTISAGDLSTTIEIPIEPVDLQSSAVQDYLIQYSVHQQTEKDEFEKLGNYTEKSPSGAVTKKGSGLRGQTEELENTVNTYMSNINRWTEQKALLNKEFYRKYSRFIQEGTWMNEEYVDDDKYYADALSVMYNSCYPQVAYMINAPTLNCLPGYELFTFELGDKTYIIDPEFFGDEEKEEVVITEMSNMLDEPEKDTIKIQNFKNQFQDLFQKIVATSQQVQYNSGSYERGAALAEAIAQNSIEFLTQTLDEMTVNLSDPDLESASTDGSSAIKIVDGKILFGKKNNGKNEWTIGMSSKGISANKITAGQIDTGVIQIMSGTEPAFRWDAYGISAFGDTEFDGVITGITTNQFVRFDKYGLYGMNGVDGLSWHATGNGYDLDPLKEINALSTFALTWEGLKVTGNDGVVAKIGKDDNHIIKVTKQDGTSEREVFAIDNNGALNLEFAMSDIEGQDNLLIKSNTFEYSQWKGFEYWSSADILDSLGNSIKKIGIFYPNGNVVSIPTNDNAAKRLLFYPVKGIKGNKYTFSFNHRHILTTSAKKSYTIGETALGEENEKPQKITIGGKAAEIHQIYVLKQNKNGSFNSEQIYTSSDKKVVDPNSYFTSEVTERRKVYEYTYDGEDGALFALGIQYSPNYSQTNTFNFVEITEDEAGNEQHYLNGNDLLISSMKLSRYSLEQKGASAGQWAYNATDNLKGIEVGQGNILQNNLTFIGDSYGSADYYVTILSEADGEDYELWQDTYSKANKLELTKPLTNGNYILSMEGSVANYDKQNCTDIRKAMVWLMPLYKTWNKDKYVISYDSTKGCQVLLDSFTTSTAYAYYTINNDIIFNQPEEGEKKQRRFVGWRLGLFRAPRKDTQKGDPEVIINKVTLERLEQMTTTNVATKTELKNTAEGLVANAYAPNGTGFGWSIKPEGFYLYKYNSPTSKNQVFSVDKYGNAWISSSLRIGSSLGSTVSSIKDNADDALDAANDAKDAATEAKELAGNAVPKSKDGQNFYWTFDDSTGVEMGNYEDTFFKIHQNETTGLYEAWISGTITANSGKIGKWNLTSDGLWYGNSVNLPNIFLYPAGRNNVTVTGALRSNIMLKVGAHFGVATDGTLYCNQGEFTGKIIANEGQFGAIKINNSQTKQVVIENTELYDLDDWSGASKSTFATKATKVNPDTEAMQNLVEYHIWPKAFQDLGDIITTSIQSVTYLAPYGVVNGLFWVGYVKSNPSTTLRLQFQADYSFGQVLYRVLETRMTETKCVWYSKSSPLEATTWIAWNKAESVNSDKAMRVSIGR